ncbi:MULTISPECIES: putative type VI secretion system effector [unclassified Serratia (in: enterobacteria)]|uniref:putative type VI secretion system effector n=1 Tax=unclassified Serratia (in: enterobacteria) TaxID=2647522 RepID=UPI00307601AC
MENETDSQLYNYTSCLRSEYKDPARLEGCFRSLRIYLENRKRQINEYDNKVHSLKNVEPTQEKDEREYIEETRLRVVRAQEYIKQVEAEKNSFPPFPELPPTKPLFKISGVLEEVSFKKVIGYFEASQYSTEIQRAEEKLKRDNKGAVFLLLAQLFAGATPLARLNDGRRKQYKCLYVKGRIGGKVFSGWLNKTNIQVGDYLEMAVMPDGDEYKMYAVANPQQGTISTTPGSNAGSQSFSFKQSLKISAIFWLLFAVPIAIFGHPDAQEWLHLILSYIALTTAMAYGMYRMAVNENRATGDLFEKICFALQIPDGKHLDLDKHTIKVIKSKEKKGERTSSKNETIPVPRGDTVENVDFYYYPKANNME